MPRKNGSKPKTTYTTNGRREKEFTTSLGVQVWVGPMPPMLPQLAEAAIATEWEEKGKPLPVKPTYETTNVAGDKETHEHDEKSLTTDEEKAAWAAWLKLRQAFDNAVVNLTFEECVRNCLRFDVDPSWPSRYKRLRPPADPVDLKDFYARAAVIGSREDVEEIMRISAELTGVDVRLMQAAEDSFPGDVEEEHAAAEPAD